MIPVYVLDNINRYLEARKKNAKLFILKKKKKKKNRNTLYFSMLNALKNNYTLLTQFPSEDEFYVPGYLRVI